MITLSEIQKSFLSKMSYLDLLDVVSHLEHVIESFCEDNNIEFPVYTLEKSKAYFQFLNNIIDPSSSIYNKDLHDSIINLIESKDKYKKEVVELHHFEIEVA